MRILILNWKDIKHPEAGGAEIATYQYAKYLSGFGHEVTLFTSHATKLKTAETIAGVRIIRQGNLYTVYLHAFFSYVLFLHLQTDIVIDQIHGIPFFTPVYVRKPILAYIHEVAGKIWDKEFSFFPATLGKLVESFYFRLYVNTPFLTDCHSTKVELMQKGLPGENIYTLPLTINRPKGNHQPKTQFPSLIYIGRISPMKRLELLVEATAELVKQFPRLQVTIAGSAKSPYLRKLKMLTSKLGLVRSVKFSPHVSEPKKDKLFAQSWLHIHPSLKEGFGLTVMEAASQRTPTVAFNVGGLRDLIQGGKTGVIVKDQNSVALVSAITDLFTNQRQLKNISQRAYRWSKTFPAWKQQAKKLEQILRGLIGHRILKNAD